MDLIIGMGLIIQAKKLIDSKNWKIINLREYMEKVLLFHSLEIGDLIKKKWRRNSFRSGHSFIRYGTFLVISLMKFTVLFQIIFGHMKLKIMPMF